MAKRKPVGRRRLFENLEGKMHMPFCDGKHLLFCRAGEIVRREFRATGSIWSSMRRNSALAERFADLPRVRTGAYRAWKLYQCNLGSARPERIPTGLPDDAIECSPAFFSEDGVLRVSFIGGVPDAERIVYRLYEMTGASWSVLSPAAPAIELPAKLGFISPLHLCYGSGSAFMLRPRNGGDERKVATPFSLLTRVSFRSDDPSLLILTGFAATSTPQSFQYDIDTGDLAEIAGEKPAYKPTLFGDQMISAESESPSPVAARSVGPLRSAERENYSLLQEGFSLAPVSKPIRAVLAPKPRRERMAEWENRP